MFIRPMKHQGTVTVIKTGVLDGGALERRLDPTMEYFTSRRRPGISVIEGTQQHEEMP